MKQTIFGMTIFFVVLLAFFGIVSCARNPVTGKKQLMLISKSQEIEMGRQADPEIVAFFGLYEDEKLQKFINEKGNEMAKISHRPDLEYEFKIVDSPVVNAFALPGGFIYFTRGIMAHFNNEAEFAGVLGHEIGHVTARHSAQQYSKSVLAELGLAVGSIMSEQFGQFADLGRAGLSLLFLKYGRDAERQSDRLGVEYSTQIGYNSKQMANFFNTIDNLQKVSGQGIPSFLSTHPNPAEREENVNKMAEGYMKKFNLANPVVNRSEYLRMIDGIVYGEDPRQGYVDDNTFFHPGMRFSFPVPQGWELQNTPQQVQMAPQDGQALMVFAMAPSNDLESSASAILQNYGLTLVGSEKINVNGFNTLALLAEQAQQQQTLTLMIYLLQDADRIYNFMGITTAPQFNNYLPIFRSSMNSFARLSNPSRINVQPDRVRIREASRSGSLADILTAMGMHESRLQELSILNGLGLQEPVQQGALIKILGK